MWGLAGFVRQEVEIRMKVMLMKWEGEERKEE
jgi:hypothetical protein